MSSATMKNCLVSARYREDKKGDEQKTLYLRNVSRSCDKKEDYEAEIMKDNDVLIDAKHIIK